VGSNLRVMIYFIYSILIYIFYVELLYEADGGVACRPGLASLGMHMTTKHGSNMTSLQKRPQEGAHRGVVLASPRHCIVHAGSCMCVMAEHAWEL
jgi:hypothetical protein